MELLPIAAVLQQLLDTLRNNANAILIAEPGAGKTTQVPLALLKQPWLTGKRIIMLEPRRLAARSAAEFMARTLGEKVGGTVGYRVRLDTKVGPHTRIEVVTEGVLTRMLQEDQALEGVGAVLFDEFHERHLHGDLGLALCLQSQELLREDLRLLVMSATLEAEPIAALLGDAPIIRCPGRTFPVETIYAAARASGNIEAAMGKTIHSALLAHDGDVLAFLPGIAEIRRTASWLAQASAGLPANVRIVELHGGLPLELQDAAIAPAPRGERKVVLATSIAESSLTVEGITIVVDSGLMRIPRFSPRTGMSRLETVAVSQASADQRRGRAGRLAPGVCYRLWTEQEQPYLAKQNTPELQDADLASLALELAVWGIRDPLELAWLTPPPIPAYEQGMSLLEQLGAVHRDGRPTGKGTQIAKLGLHPRLGAMILKAAEHGEDMLRQASRLAGLLSERDIRPQERNVDMQLRLDALRQPERDAAAQRIITQAKQWERMMAEQAQHKANAGSAPLSIGVLLAYAYPDRIAQRRGDGRYLMAGGRGAALPELQPLSRAAYLVCCELDDAGVESRIRLAAQLALEEIEQHLTDFLAEEAAVEWDAAAQSVRARRRRRLGSIVLKESPLQQPDAELVAGALLAAIRETGIEALPMNKQAKQLQARMQLMALSGDERWPDASDEALLRTMEEWLKPHIYGMRSRSDLQKLSMAELLGGMLTWKQRQELDEQAPTHIVVPSGSRIPVNYQEPGSPVLAVRLQELFGMSETPRLAYGRLPVTLHLLSPSQRPVQVTRDLKSFWETTYFEVKKDLKGRYPKHYWPDDPYTAVATRRAKPRGE